MDRYKVKVIYISGSGRSGSTLFGRLLASSLKGTTAGEIACIGRRGVAGNEMCSCGKPFLECLFWSEVLERLGEFNNDAFWRYVAQMERYICSARGLFLLNPFLRKHMLKRIRPYLRFLANLYAAVSMVGGSSIVVDESKFPGYGILLHFVEGIEIETVFLIRDPRAVSYSWLTPKFNPGEGKEMASYGVVLTSARWMLRNWFVLQKWPSRVTVVRYEDMVQDPESAMQNVAQSVLDIKLTLPPVIEPAWFHTFSGNPIRFSKIDAIRKDIRWKQGMSAWRCYVVTLLTLPGLRFHGYPVWEMRKRDA